MSPSLPLVAATIGLHGSASTWAFNVARELLLAAGPPQDTLSCYAENLGDIPPQATSRPRPKAARRPAGVTSAPRLWTSVFWTPCRPA